MSFVPLHIHSDYSLLDGASQLPELVDRAIALGMKAIALTDHGVMYGAVELIKICRSKTIKPIIGNEMYILNGDIEKQERRPKYHQVVLAKNTQGYKNLVKITTISHLQGVQGKGIFSRPCINKDLLKQYREGLIVTSACLGGEIPQAILSNRQNAARKVAKWYKEVFGEDFYLEIQDHGSQEDRIVNVEVVKIARELGIKFIATNDSHFISCFDVESHDALLCIQTGKLISEDKRMRYSGTEYLKSSEEMHQLFRDHLPDDIIAEAIATTEEIADKVEPYHIMGDPQIPTPQIPSGHTADTYAEEVAWEGLLERLKRKSRNEVDQVYKERLEYELKMIQQMGFSTYFLVVWDYIKFARDSNIPVGPGRGSAAGSLVAYAMKITNIDPVHHGLLFERFLNPERKSMPDIDTDFCIDKRDQVIEYVTNKYGVDRVAQIITFNRLTSKAVLKDVARVLDIPYGDSDKMAKMIPVVRGKPTKLKVMISDETPEPEFKAKYDNDPTVRRWIDMAMRIEGTNKTFGVHAAGVVISAEPLDELVPLQRNNDGSVITQYFMEDLESLGLLKMDFLGLRNLTLIQKTIDLIAQSKGYRIDPDEITGQERKAQKILAKGDHTSLPKDVAKAYSLLEAGDLEGIFQLESSGMKQRQPKGRPGRDHRGRRERVLRPSSCEGVAPEADRCPRGVAEFDVLSGRRVSAGGVVLHRTDHDPPDERVAARGGVARVREPGAQVAVGVPGLGVVDVGTVAVEVARCWVPVGEHLGRTAEVEVARRGRPRRPGAGEDADVVTGADHGSGGQGERGQRRVADRPAADVQRGVGVVEHHHVLVVRIVADRVRDDPGPNGGRGRRPAEVRRPETHTARGGVIDEPPVLEVVGVLRLLGVRQAVWEPHRVAPGEDRAPGVDPRPGGVLVVDRSGQSPAGVVGLHRAHADRAQLDRGAGRQDRREGGGGGAGPTLLQCRASGRSGLLGGLDAAQTDAAAVEVVVRRGHRPIGVDALGAVGTRRGDGEVEGRGRCDESGVRGRLDVHAHGVAVGDATDDPGLPGLLGLRRDRARGGRERGQARDQQCGDGTGDDGAPTPGQRNAAALPPIPAIHLSPRTSTPR